MTMRVLMTGGGTGGTITPLLAVAKTIQQREPTVQFLFLITKNPIERTLVTNSGFAVRTFPAGKWRRYLDLRNLRDLFIIGYAYIRGCFLLLTYRPSVVVSAGSFLSVPVVWAAKLLGIPSLIHQQDVAAGLANRLMASSASVITVTFEESMQQFAKHPAVRLTGNPTRAGLQGGDAQRARTRFSLEADVPLLVVLGGSSGARFFADLLRRTVKDLVSACQILHITGKNTLPDLPVHRRYHTTEFLFDGLADCFAAAQLVLTRAGVSTITELAAAALPSLVIPMPETHQEANSRMLAAHHAAIVLDEPTLTAGAFVQQVMHLLKHESERSSLGQHLRQLNKPDAADRIADEIIRLGTRT